MTITHVNTSVPLVIEVDTDTGEVLKVVVLDESDLVYEDVTLDDGTTIASPEEKVATLDVLSGDAEWPSWQFSW